MIAPRSPSPADITGALGLTPTLAEVCALWRAYDPDLADGIARHGDIYLRGVLDGCADTDEACPTADFVVRRREAVRVSTAYLIARGAL